MRAAVWTLPVTLAVTLAACGGKGDSGGEALPPVEVAGSYNVQVTGTSGCDGQAGLIDDWARGPLQVSGAGAALRFDFGQDAVVDGEVDSKGQLRLGGRFAVGGVERSLSGGGQVTEEDDQRTIDAEIAVVVALDPPCTIDGLLVATELVDLPSPTR